MGRPSLLSPKSFHQSPRQAWTQPFSPLSPRPPIDDRKEDNEVLDQEVIVSVLQKVVNFLGCIVAAIIYAYLLLYSNHLWTIDTSASVLLAEYCGWSNERLRKKSAGNEAPQVDESGDLSLAEKGGYFSLTKNPSESAKPECIAAVVGYREDPAIFTKALESYLQADGCRFMLVCIDGNSLEDQEMVDVFQKVPPPCITRIRSTF